MWIIHPIENVTHVTFFMDTKCYMCDVFFEDPLLYRNQNIFDQLCLKYWTFVS